MGKLILTLDGAVLREIPLNKQTLSIGRRAGNDIQLNDLAVSGRHALLTMPQHTYIEDLGSTNGTLVNGSKVRKTMLNHADVVQIGSHQFTFLSEDEESYEPTMFLKAEFEPTVQLDASKLDTSDARGAPLANVKVLSGPLGGKVMSLRKPFNTIGMRGIKVALITRTQRGYYIQRVRSKDLKRASDQPTVNGNPIGESSYLLRDRDLIEVVGTQMEFFFTE